jgi:hypothetical protein
MSRAVPGYQQIGGELVTTGRTITAQEYRYASKTSWLRLVVRWYERGDSVIVATLGYPDPAKIPAALTGLDPDDLIHDLRLID